MRDVKLAIGRAAEHVGFGAQLCQCRCESIRAAAMCDQVYAFDTRRPADDAYHLQQVLDGVFGRFAVDVVAEQNASVPAGRPCEDAAHEVPSQEMAQLAHRQRGTLEAGVVAVHEQHDFLAARDSEPPRNLGLQLLLRLFVRLDDGGYTSYAIRSDNDFIRYGRKATELRGRPELELQWIDALRRGAFLDQHVPGDVFAELDHRRSERHRTRSARGIRQVVGLLCRCAIGDEQQIERRPATVDRQLGEKRLGIRPGVEHRGRHQRVIRRATRQDEGDGGDDDG